MSSAPTKDRQTGVAARAAPEATSRPARTPGTGAWRSLGARLALWYIAVTVFSFGAVATVITIRTSTWLAAEGQRSADSAVERYRRAFETAGTEGVRSLFDSFGGPGPGVSIRVTDEQNIELLMMASDEPSGQIAELLRQAEASPSRGNGVPKDWHIAVARVQEGRNLQLVVHDAAASRVWQNARGTLWAIAGWGLASAVVGAFVISRRALRPLSRLARATQDIIASGDLRLRVEASGSADDLDQLAVLFNRMLARNEALVRAMKESLDNVAHDLRTPLTRLRAGAELALRRPHDLAAAEEALADVLEESDRVLGMLRTLMDISEAEAGAMRLQKRVEDLSLIAREAVELYDLVSNERGVHVLTNLATGVLVWVDRQRVLQACANLIDNAIKYTPAGGTVEVSVSPARDENMALLAIADTGIGIPPEDAPRVWDRLFRGDRSRPEHGLGLGLSLVKAVVEAHGGNVVLCNNPAGGATFEVRLERASRSPQS